LAVLGVSLVEVRQQVMTDLGVGLGQFATQGVDQVLLLLGSEGAEQLTGLLEVLGAVDRRLLGGPAQGQLAVHTARIFLAVHATARLVVHAASGLVAVELTVLVAVVDRRFGLVDRQAHVVGTDAVHLGIGIGE